MNMPTLRREHNMPKTSAAKMRADIKYQKKAVRQIKFNFNKSTDYDILEKLDSVENKQGYIKELIRSDIAKNK